MEPINSNETHSTASAKRNWLVALFLALAVVTLFACGGNDEQATENTESTEAEGEHANEEEGLIELSPEAVIAAGIEYAQVIQRTAMVPLQTTGTIEANQQRMQQ